MLTVILILCAYTAVSATVIMLRKPPSLTVGTTQQPPASNVGVHYMDARHEGKIREQLETDE